MEETQPLLRPVLSREESGRHDQEHRPDPSKGFIIVDFDPNGDSDNPMDWPKLYRWGIVGLLALMAFTVTFTCIGLVPIATRIVANLDDGRIDKSASVLLVTIWELGEAIGPLIQAPCSELFGRYPVYNLANVLFIGATLLAVLSQTVSLFISARFLTGLAVASNVLAPAIVADIFPSEQRGTAMSLIMFAPLTGGAIAPTIAGAIVQSSSWRNVLWMSIGLAGACELAFLTLFRETYKVTILQRRAARLRKGTGNPLFRTPFDGEEGRSIFQRFGEPIVRPASVFWGSNILKAISLFGAVAFSYFYIMSTTLPDILEGIYHLSPAATGSAFIIFSIGSGACIAICNVFLDRIYIKLRDSHKGVGQPEYRIPLIMIGALTMPIVIAAYGWNAQLQSPLWLTLLTEGLLGSTLMLAAVPWMVYVADAFGIYTASATTVVIVSRCLLSTFLPLATEPLVHKFGYGYAFTILGGISLALAPTPFLIYRYGEKWRQRSSYTRDESYSEQ